MFLSAKVKLCSKISKSNVGNIDTSWKEMNVIKKSLKRMNVKKTAIISRKMLLTNLSKRRSSKRTKVIANR